MKDGAYRNRILGLEYVNAGDLTAHPGNWRDHPKAQVAALKGVLAEVGIAGALLAYRSERQGGALVVIDGHLRKDAAPQKWPVLILDVDDAEADYLLATHDPLAAMATADAGALDALLSSVQSGDAAVQAMLAELANGAGLYQAKDTENAEPQVDRAEELRQEWGVEPGQLWRLPSRTPGQEHRLICGDCTDAATVGRVDTFGNSLLFDPPWETGFPAPVGYSSTLAFGDGSTIGSIVSMLGAPTWLFSWDCVSSWYTPNRPLRRMKLCAWYGNIEDYDFDGWHYGDAGAPRTVWNTRGEYQFHPDPRGKHLSDVFSFPITQLHADATHSHIKPLDWVTLLVANCTRGDIYDPFLGSGTTLIAAENLARQCRAVELSPGYVAVALQRYLDVFGIRAELIND